MSSIASSGGNSRRGSVMGPEPLPPPLRSKSRALWEFAESVGRDGKGALRDYQKEKHNKAKSIYQKRLDECYDFGCSVGITRDILKARNDRWRIIYLITAIMASVAATIQISELFNNYFIIYPSQTEVNYVVNISAQFPTVTICTYARVNATEIRRLNVSDELLSYMLSAYKGMYLFYNDFNMRQRQEALEVEYQAFLDSREFTFNFSLTKFFILYGMRCVNVLRGCMFQGTTFTCCRNQEPVLSDVGKCWQVNSEKFPEQTIPGPTGGMRIDVDNNANHYPKTLVNSNPDMGVQVHIVHPGENIQLISSPDLVFPGTHAMIMLTATKLELLEKPGSSCINNRQLEFFDSYTSESCFVECIAKMTLKTCRCIQLGSIPDYSRLEPSELCDPLTATACVQPLLQANNMGYLWEIYDIRKNCDCPMPCNKWLYSKTVSYSTAPYPNYIKAKSMATGVKDDAPKGKGNRRRQRRDEILIDIYFDSLIYRQIKESPQYTHTDFFSSLGGQLSIWFGVRLLTAVHLLNYGVVAAVCFIPIWLERLKKRSNKVQREVRSRASSVFSRDSSRASSRSGAASPAGPLSPAPFSPHGRFLGVPGSPKSPSVLGHEEAAAPSFAYPASPQSGAPLPSPGEWNRRPSIVIDEAD